MKQTPQEIRKALKEKGFSDDKIDLIIEKALNAQEKILKMQPKTIEIKEFEKNIDIIKKIKQND